MKKAIITGITGQDGSYLAELLLGKGYHVYGWSRSMPEGSSTRIDHLLTNREIFGKCLFLEAVDFAEEGNLVERLRHIQPDEFYHLAAQSGVRASVDLADFTASTNALGTLRMLEAIRKSRIDIRFYQASSSEMFGYATESPQSESTPFRPRNPYGTSKVFAHWTTVNYRETHGLHASSGILYNHESPRRPEAFVTRRISANVARIARGLQNELGLGRIDTCRDWGYAPEYVEGIWQMLQQESPDDYVLATGERHTVGEFLAAAFAEVNLDWRAYVVHDFHYDRPSEVIPLVGNPAKAREKLGWHARTRFHDLVKLMVQADLQLLDQTTPETTPSGDLPHASVPLSCRH